MRLAKLCVLMSSLILFGCESKGDKDTPTLSEIFTTITHAHASYENKVPPTDVATDTKLYGSMEFRVNDDAGVDDINKIILTDVNNGEETMLLDRLSNDVMGPGYIDFQEIDGVNVLIDIFRYDFDYEEISRQIELDNWSLRVVDLKGYDSSSTFDLALFDGDAAIDEEFVYASGEADTTNGVEALQVLEATDISAGSSEFTRTMSISFDVTDARAKNYEIWIYDNDDLSVSPEHIVPSDSPSIVSTPIVQGGTTNLELPWDEIPSNVVFAPESLDGIHVVLLDGGEESPLVANRLVYSQRSISEYVSFTVER